MVFICCDQVGGYETFPPRMDMGTRYPAFPQPPPTRVRCLKSLPRLVTLGRNYGDVRGETPEMPTTAFRDSDKGADRAPSNHATNFSTFLSAASTVLRVTATGNYPSLTTAAHVLLTEIGDVCPVSSPQPRARSSSDWTCIAGIDAVADIHLGGQERMRRWQQTR